MTEEIRTNESVSLMLTGEGARLRDHFERRELALPAALVPDLARVLAIGRDWVIKGRWLSLVTEVTQIAISDAERVLNELEGQGILRRRNNFLGTSRLPVFADSSRWDAYRWSEAFAYHRAVRAIPMSDWSTPDGARDDIAMMERFVAEEPPPPDWLDRSGGRRVTLPAVDAECAGDGPVRDTIVNGRDESELPIDDFSRLLWLAFGQTGTRRLPVTGEHPRRTSPSGGSRHPTEAYVLVLDVEAVKPATYHYSPRSHTLDEVDGRDPSPFFYEDVLMLRGRLAFRPRFAVILASYAERSMYRYRDARSYRVLYLDAGHLLQTAAYAASAAGRPSYRGYTMRVPSVSKRLSLCPLEQIPLAFGAFG